jgi:hypothetical protein
MALPPKYGHPNGRIKTSNIVEYNPRKSTPIQTSGIEDKFVWRELGLNSLSRVSPGRKMNRPHQPDFVLALNPKKPQALPFHQFVRYQVDHQQLMTRILIPGKEDFQISGFSHSVESGSR